MVRSRLGTNAIKLLTTALLLSGVVTGTNKALAQTILGENFSAKKLKKFEHVYDKKMKDDKTVEKAAEAYHISTGKVVKMLDEESDYMIYEVLPNLVVDHTVLKKQNLSGLQIKNILDFLLYGEGHDKYFPLAKGLVDKLLAYETNDKISNKVKFPFTIPSEYTKSLGSDYSTQTAIIKDMFEKGLPDMKNQLETGSTKVWFADQEAWNKFKEQNKDIVNYVVKMSKKETKTNNKTQTSRSVAKAGEKGEEFIPTPNDKLKGGIVVIDFNLKNVNTDGKEKKFINKTKEQTAIMYQLVYWKFIETKYDQYMEIIPRIANDATEENN